MNLSDEDWIEIYYALESKAIAIEHGAYADDKRGKKRWIRHLREIMNKIGTEGCNMMKGDK